MFYETLGKFRIVKWIGGGQFSDVFLALDTYINKEFAIKISRQRAKDIEMLKQEARVLASLEHPNIVRFYSIEEINGRIILVMEYVEGESLRSYLDRVRKLSVDKAISFTKMILDGVGHAHRKGILHRDIKPENILITDDGKIKITDFGLARIKTGFSMSLSVAGTPLYMSPEAWKGEYDRRSDIYSIGVILYEMLSGRLPYEGESFEQLRQKILHGKLRKIRGLSPKLWLLVQKAMSRRPDDRFQSCEEFAKSLKESGYMLEISGLLEDRGKKSGILSGLTPAQEEAVVKGDGISLVIGSAGTGKTYTLARRIAYLIKEKNVDPENILAITFTGKAAGNLKMEVATLLGELLTRKLWAGTFHQMAMRIFLSAADRLGFNEEELVIISPEDALSIIESLSPSGRAKAIKRTIERAKTNLIEPEEYRKLAKTSWEKNVSGIYMSYQNLLRARNMVDYGDILLYAVKTLEEFEDIREEFTSRFRYILVDEFQDIDPAQFRLIRILSEKHGNLFLTGDDDQSIYGFRGADPEFIRELEKYYEGKVKRFYLTTSFRVPQKILESAERLISFNKKRVKKPMVSMAKSEGVILFKEADSEEKEASWVAEMIHREVESGLQYDDISVIYRVNAYSRYFEEVFIREDIPYNLQSEGGFYEREEIRSIIGILKLAEMKASFNDVELIAHRIFSLSQKQARYVAAKFTGKRTRTKLTQEEKENADSIIEILKQFSKSHDEKLLGEMTPLEVVEGFMEQFGYFERLERARTPARIQERENVLEFLEFMGNYKRGEHRKLQNDVALLRTLGIESQSQHGVKLMTVHQAKGLEFPCVFVVGLYEGRFPLLSKYGRDDDIEEERRLFYVAITRSQDKLYLSYPRFRYGKYRNEPSIFITEMFLKPEV